MLFLETCEPLNMYEQLKQKDQNYFCSQQLFIPDSIDSKNYFIISNSQKYTFEKSPLSLFCIVLQVQIMNYNFLICISQVKQVSYQLTVEPMAVVKVHYVKKKAMVSTNVHVLLGALEILTQNVYWVSDFPLCTFISYVKFIEFDVNRNQNMKRDKIA